MYKTPYDGTLIFKNYINVSHVSIVLSSGTPRRDIASLPKGMHSNSGCRCPFVIANCVMSGSSSLWSGSLVELVVGVVSFRFSVVVLLVVTTTNSGVQSVCIGVIVDAVVFVTCDSSDCRCNCCFCVDVLTAFASTTTNCDMGVLYTAVYILVIVGVAVLAFLPLDSPK